MNNPNPITIINGTCLLLAGLMLLGGCGQSPPEQTESTSNQLLANYLLSSEPVDAMPVATARSEVEPGQDIILRGQVGGTLKPFNSEFAVMVIADQAVMFCDEMDDDHCETPWDACCEDADKLKMSRATVQMVDESGTPLAATLRGLGGLQELDHVSVTGTVDESSTDENLLVNASGIYIHKE